MSVNEKQKRAVTMGNFDGCHLGHQALFRTLKAVAEVNGLTPTVISFEPHSNYVLRTPGDPLLLTTTEEKREFIESLGLEFLVLPFTPEVAKLPFDEFVRTELIKKRGVCSMFFGHDHCFGAGGKGNYETITVAFPELSTAMLSIVLPASCSDGGTSLFAFEIAVMILLMSNTTSSPLRLIIFMPLNPPFFLQIFTFHAKNRLTFFYFSVVSPTPIIDQKDTSYSVIS